ncbi:MAG: hypothetical protein C0467_02850 [Planctomycetaceae bacterium]|nr:hypothetical protein [Planctomycetaceae bacterium]
MMVPNTRREFLADVGRGMLVASLGSSVASDLGLAFASAADAPDVLNFGKLEPLVALLQETPTNKLMPVLVARLKDGLDLRTLVAAGALANARSFGGQHYEGYHTFMALAPAFEMSKELPEAQKPLPVLKVLYRNATHIQASGGRAKEILHPVKPTPVPEGKVGGEALQELTRKFNTKEAEGVFASLAQDKPEDAFNHVLYCVEDDINVHRTVLAWRSWAMLDFTGPEHAHTLLRQSVRFCCNEKGGPQGAAIRKLLPQLLDQNKLVGKKLGSREGDAAWVEALAKVVYSSGREKAAEAVAIALTEGFSPTSITEALSVAANQLLLNDPGRPEANGGKAKGTVHGDSVGLHASDAANAWGHIAAVSNQRNTVASLIVGAFHTAGQNGGQLKDAYHTPELEKIKASDAATFLKQTDEAVRTGNQALAAALVQKYGEAGNPERAVFDLLLKYGVSEDGALHAEKYYRTASEEFATMRSAFKWRQLVSLARVTASEYGRTAPGYDEARKLLGV